MTAAIETIFAAWAETDDTERRRMLASCAAEDIRYDDPIISETLIGLAALNAYIGKFSANAPGWTARVVKQNSTAGMTRATIAFGGPGPDGSDMVQLGQYFVESNQAGLITRMTGFAGTGAPE